ncbi:MAG: hypothetical protein EBZ07_07455 [Verrucomicrobia bacterium]|nr:hypothetical protein [Verrucomicrobiota bacterium]
MNRPARPFRRTVLIVAAIHLGLILVVGLPFATCQKPKKINVLFWKHASIPLQLPEKIAKSDLENIFALRIRN